jgi:hypothetical protein
MAADRTCRGHLAACFRCDPQHISYSTICLVEPTAALPLHIEVGGLPADASTRGFTDGILPLDVSGYFVPLRHDPPCDVGTEKPVLRA